MVEIGKKKEDFKIILLGMSQKSEMFAPFMGNKFKGDYKSSTGVQFFVNTVEIENFEINLVIWDISSQSEWQQKMNLYGKDGDAAIIIEDNEDKIKTWKDLVLKFASKDAEIIVLSPNDSVEGVLETLAKKLIKNKYE